MKKLVKLITVLAIAVLTALPLVACGGNKTKIVYSDIALTGEQYGYCVAPNNTELLNSVNSILAEIKEDGTLQALYDAEDNGTASNIGAVQTTSSNRANELVVATNAEFEPFEYKQGAYFAGIDMQIAKIIATKLNKTLVIVDMDFDSVILDVAQGNSDIGMAGLTISDGRSENVTFSAPYYDTTQCIAYKEGDTRFSECKTADEIIAAVKALKDAKGGAAKGQTGELYLNGSEDFEFEGFSNITVKSYDTIALAVKDLANGNIDFVVGDMDTVKAAVEATNK